MVVKRLLSIGLFYVLLVVSNILQAYKITFENKTEYRVSCLVAFRGIGDRFFSLIGVDRIDCGSSNVALDSREKGTVGSKDTRCLIRGVIITVNTGKSTAKGPRISIKYEAGPGKVMKKIGNQTIVIEPADSPKYIKIRRK